MRVEQPVLCWWVEGAAVGERTELRVHGSQQGPPDGIEQEEEGG